MENDEKGKDPPPPKEEEGNSSTPQKATESNPLARLKKTLTKRLSPNPRNYCSTERLYLIQQESQKMLRSKTKTKMKTKRN